MKHKKLRILSLAVIAVVSIVAVGCSCFMPSLNIPWDEHLSCSPDLQVIEHGTTCGKLSTGDMQCTIEGTIENKGIGVAKNVRVRVQWSAPYDYVYWNPTAIGDLQPGQTAEFEARFNGYEYPNRYDIYVECDSYQ